MSATAERAADRLMRAGGRAELVKEMLTATFDVICDVALSGREHFDSETFSRAITQYFQTAGRASMLDFLGFPEWFPRPGELLAGVVGPHHACHGGHRHRCAPQGKARSGEGG